MTTVKLVSFIDDLITGDTFYYVNVEFFKKSKEYSNVSFYEIEVMKVTKRTLHVKQYTISGPKRQEKAKLSIKQLRFEDLEDDYAGGYKRTKEQALFFLNEYKNFIEFNAQSEDSDEPVPLEQEFKEHCLSVIQDGIDRIEGKYIIQ